MNGLEGGTAPGVNVRNLVWRKSRRCQNGECVEVCYGEDRVLVRNSREPCMFLEFSPAEWGAFITFIMVSAPER